MSAKNHAGYAAYALDNLMGWRRATKVFKTRGEAVTALHALPAGNVERQVRECVMHMGVLV